MLRASRDFKTVLTKLKYLNIWLSAIFILQLIKVFFGAQYFIDMKHVAVRSSLTRLRGGVTNINITSGVTATRPQTSLNASIALVRRLSYILCCCVQNTKICRRCTFLKMMFPSQFSLSIVFASSCLKLIQNVVYFCLYSTAVQREQIICRLLVLLITNNMCCKRIFIM